MDDAGAHSRLKVRSLEELEGDVAQARERGQRVALCHGVFDLVHPGHLHHLQAAKALADVLVVAVIADDFVHKGPGRPAFNEALRAEFLAALEPVDLVVIDHSESAVGLIHLLKPNVYVRGSDYVRRDDDPTGRLYAEERAVASVGGRIHFTDSIAFSSTELINTHFSRFAPEVESWLKEFRARHSVDEVLDILGRAFEKKVLVVGEAIIDEYIFCVGLAKSSKDPLLAFLYRSVESYAGGSLAIANHVAGLGGQVGLVAQLGDQERREEFIRGHLLPHVDACFPTRENSPTIAKRRFIDGSSHARVFEVYFMNDAPPSPDDHLQVARALRDRVADYDIVIIADYGHGMMDASAIQEVTTRSKFLAVNTQSNAGNRGFNTIARYPRADYVCLAGHEAELEARMKNASWEELVDVLAQRIRCPHFTITRGRAGTYHTTLPDQRASAPALATFVADRVGAGDAVLAVTSPLVAVGAPWDVIGFVGNVAGAHMVAELGNRSTINRAALTRSITGLMR
jgi:rfaE bifunctional protein nucleotidyltransferase chain/domain